MPTGRVVAASALAALAAALLCASTGRARPAPARVDGADRAVMRAIDAARRAHGLRPLRTSTRMSVGAAAHSCAMARTGVLAHGAWVSRVRRYAHARTIGEVVGWLSRGGARAIVAMWMDSPTHRAVLLGRGYRRAGVGRCRRGRATYFTVDVAR
jgi:uncharacterized protein YkwD